MGDRRHLLCAICSVHCVAGKEITESQNSEVNGPRFAFSIGWIQDLSKFLADTELMLKTLFFFTRVLERYRAGGLTIMGCWERRGAGSRFPSRRSEGSGPIDKDEHFPYPHPPSSISECVHVFVCTFYLPLELGSLESTYVCIVLERNGFRIISHYLQAVADLGTGEPVASFGGRHERLLGGGTSTINSHIGELAYWRPLLLQWAVPCTEAE